MTDIGDRLLVIRDHLRTGAVGQREVWEEWLAEAADELDQLFWSKAALQTEIDRLRGLNDDQYAVIERLTSERNDYEAESRRHIKTIAELRHENARLQKIVDGTERREAEYLALIEKRTAQLPDGMKHCTILFKECEKGHGRLTATNWIDHGCPHCEIAQLKAKQCDHGFPTREDCPTCQHFDKVRNSETC